jgi:glutamate dehydrogenase
MDLVITALDIIEVARSTGVTLEQTAATYLALDDDLRLGWLRQRINGLPRNDRWESLARSALRDDFFRAHVELTESILASPGPDASTASANDPVGDLAQPWIDGRRHAVEHCLTVLSDIRASGRTDLAQLSVAVRELRNLIHVAQRDTSPSP